MSKKKILPDNAIQLFVLIVVSISISLAGAHDTTLPAAAHGTTSAPTYHPFLINNIFNYYGNNGEGSHNIFSSTGEGLEYPKGSGKTTVYDEGILWGGFHKSTDTPMVGGSTYLHGLQGGKILTAGTPTSDPVADDASLPKYRIYRVRPDINPSVTFFDVENKLTTEEAGYIGRYEPATAQDIYNQYIQDWNEWPASDGAPYTDVNHDGVYDPAVDIPGQPGADQTLWYVANDINFSAVRALTGSDPIGLEMQRTVWGFNHSGTPANIVFTTTLLINKSGATIDSMFIAQWVDPDLGDAGDDFVGCDTARQMGYVYNGNAVDATYGTMVPAVGYTLLQGPRVTSPGDSALFRGERRAGFKNLPMTSFEVFCSTNFAYFDPPIGTGGNTAWYRAMKGLTILSGAPIIDPVSQQPTKFSLSGNPVQATDGSAGWVDGLYGLTPGDRRMCLASGPFTMANGDTQEVVVAAIVGLGADRLASILNLRDEWKKVNDVFGAIVTSAPPVRQATEPLQFRLEQNYPNPFNPTTVVSGQLAMDSRIKLGVYDLLGREIAVLADGKYPAGKFSFTFDGSGLASGIYIYRLTAGQYSASRSMILIK